MNRSLHFIGYPTIEQFAAQISVAEPINCMLLTEPGPTTDHGLRTDKLVIVVSQSDDRGDAYYVRLPVGSLSWIGDTAFDSDQPQRRERARQAYAIVRDWLQARFTVREAAIAMPTDYRLLDGWADFLEWNKDAKKFYLKGTQQDEPFEPRLLEEIGSREAEQ